MIPAIIGVIILIVIIYVALRILKNIVFGILLIASIFFASFLIFGSMPSLSDVPIVGKYLAKLPLPPFPTTTGGAIAIIRNVFYSIEVLDVGRDAEGNLLVVVANTGKLDLSGLHAYVDGQAVKTLNSPREPLKSGETTVLQVEWQGSFMRVDVKTEKASASYEAD